MFIIVTQSCSQTPDKKNCRIRVNVNQIASYYEGPNGHAVLVMAGDNEEFYYEVAEGVLAIDTLIKELHKEGLVVV